VKRQAPAGVGDSILRLPAVLARVGLSRDTVYRLIRKGAFPRPLTLSTQSVGWRASDIDRWIAERVNPTEAARR
jgi:prophage regulatory protein